MSFIATDNIAYTNINSLHTQINPKEGSAEELRTIADTDTNRVVKIHCLGAVKATE